jgi:antitoxin VapB
VILSNALVSHSIKMIYTLDIHRGLEATLSRTGIARIFMHGRSQAVRLPREFRLPGDRVRVRHVGNGVLLEPIIDDVDVWFAELDRFQDVPFMAEGREQPPMPDPEDLFE